MTAASNCAGFSFQKVERPPVGTANGNAPESRKGNIIQFYSESRPKPQPDAKPVPEGLTALYARLSQEDRFSTEGESNSIANQKAMLEKYCREHGYSGIRFYEDDGYSGTTFDRPGFQSMLGDIKEGRIKRVVVKDMSRLGRDYLQVGMFTDILFPDLGVHFIAIGDGVDSKRGENEFTAIRNIFNEMYSRDTSKKTKAVLHAKGKSGKRISSKVPYGYVKDPDAKDRWLVDEDAAAVVQKIFSLCIDGMGPRRIARWLTEHEVLCPSAYFVSKGIWPPRRLRCEPFDWSPETVKCILGRLEYLGHTVNFKRSKPSYKSKKTVLNDPDKWMVFEDTQEPIVEESVFHIVQNLQRGRQKKRPTKIGEPPIFSGVAYCGDCGSKMYQHRSAKGQLHLLCSGYRKKHNVCGSTHYIRNAALEEIVLKNLREAIVCVAQFENEFIRAVNDCIEQEQNGNLLKKKRALAEAEARILEIDKIICHLYEDNVNGKLSDVRFVKLSSDYEREQDSLKEKAESLREELKGQERTRKGAEDFVAVAKKYTDLKKLDATILREFVERIDIYHRDSETKTQKVEIDYNFIGAFDFEGFERTATLSKRAKKQKFKREAV